MQVALDFFEGNGMFLFISLVIPSTLFTLAALGFFQDKQWTRLVFWTIALIVWSWLVISIYWGNFSHPCLIQGPYIECEIVERPAGPQRGRPVIHFNADLFPPKSDRRGIPSGIPASSVILFHLFRSLFAEH